MPNQPTNPAEALAKRPVRWTIAAVAIAIMFSLATNVTVRGVYNLIAYYETAISTEQQLAAVSSMRAKTTPTPGDVLEFKAPVESDRIIVRYKADAKLPPGLTIAAERANLEKAQGLTKVLTINGIDAEVYQVSEDDTAGEVVDRLLASKRDLIEYAEVDMLVPPAYTPNDPLLTQTSAWHHAKIASYGAWDTAKGDGVTIAILDSGTNCDHADLKPNCVSGWNVSSNSADTSDVNGHGTMTAGNAASRGDNSLGGSGVAYNAKIMPIRISDAADGWASCSAIASGITYAADHGARVASNSYYITGCTVINDAARYILSKGGVYVRAAGNDTTQLTETNDPNFLIVSATDSGDKSTTWTNYGTPVDLSAPGLGVYCTSSSGGYGSCWGTSFSVPTVSGVLALMFSANSELTATQAMNILLSSSDDLGEPGWDQYYGHGRVNAGKAVAAALAATGTRDTVAPSVPGSLHTTDVKTTSATLAWNASTDDNSGVAGYTIYRDGAKLTTVAGTSYTNSNLNANTTYTYTVRAEDAQGNSSADSAPLAVTTPDVTFGISSYSVPTKTTTGATVSATLTKAGTVTIKYGTTNTNLNLTTTSATTTTSHSVSLTNLTANTTYYYQVVATDGTNTVTGAVSSFKTTKTAGGGKPRR